MKSRSRRRKTKSRSKRQPRSRTKAKKRSSTGCPPEITLRDKGDYYYYSPNYVKTNFNNPEIIYTDELYLQYPETTQIVPDHPLLNKGKILYYTDNLNYLVVQTSNQVCIYDSNQVSKYIWNPLERLFEPTIIYTKVYQGPYASVLPGYNLKDILYHGKTVLIDIGHEDYICVGKDVVQMHMDHSITHYYSLETRKTYINPDRHVPVSKFWFDTENNVFIVKHDNTIYKLKSGRDVIEKVLRGNYIPYENDTVEQRKQYKPYDIEVKRVRKKDALFDPMATQFGDDYL